MKKFLLFPIFFMLGMIPDFCLAMCGERQISFQGIQAPGDDEFVYQSTSDYLNAVERENNGERSFPLDNLMWECDEEQGCKHNTAILAPSGHAWDEQQNKPETLYWCTAYFGDKWEAFSFIECEDNFYEDLKRTPALENLAVDMNDTFNKPVYQRSENNGRNRWFCYINPEKLACLKGEGTVWFQDKCSCVKSSDGKEREWNGKTCVEVVNEESKQIENKEEMIAEQPKLSCVQQRCGGLTGSQKSECEACCYVPASLAKWENGVCKCQQNPDQKFNPATSQCEDVVNVTQDQYECDATKIAKVKVWQNTYASNEKIVALIISILDYCEGDQKNGTTFNAMFEELQNIINEIQKLDAERIANNESKTKISSAVAELDKISSGFEKSNWKTEEGKFNTARLISDSVAGVVLGTAGGLITSSVVKKNQVENGFEDIQCTVGGQVVAGWGDQFQVGIH